MNEKLIYDFGRGICEIERKDFIIMVTELGDNYTGIHTYIRPDIVLEKFCYDRKLDINTIICICHMCSKSYFIKRTDELPHIYKLVEFEQNSIWDKIKFKETKLVKQPLIDLILDSIDENTKMNKQKLIEKFKLIFRDSIILTYFKNVQKLP